MTYISKCPYCGATVRGGHGIPIKRIDTPVRMCHSCQAPYLDDNMYEWSVISIPYKVYFILFANNRLYGWFFLLLLSMKDPYYAAVGCVIWPLICVFWFYITKRKRIAASKMRTTDAKYIEFLSRSNYDKLSQKYDIYY